MRALQALGLMAGLTACAPPCAQVCHKLDRCDPMGTAALDDCIDACEFGSSDARERKDRDMLDAYREHRACIGTSTCEAIAQGACYDPRLYAYDVSQP